MLRPKTSATSGLIFIYLSIVMTNISGNPTSTDQQFHRQDVLSPSSQKLLPFFQKFFGQPTQKNWYLAGGTNLALVYGHRISEDFDFFSTDSFDPMTQAHAVQACLSKDHTCTIIHTAHETLYLLIDKTKVSFISYHYPLVHPLIYTNDLLLADKRDVGSMKLQAIQWRATKKDYVDLAYLLQEIWFADLYATYQKKYPLKVQDSLLIKYLLYTEDIESTDIFFTDPSMHRERILLIIQQALQAY